MTVYGADLLVPADAAKVVPQHQMGRRTVVGLFGAVRPSGGASGAKAAQAVTQGGRDRRVGRGAGQRLEVIVEWNDAIRIIHAIDEGTHGPEMETLQRRFYEAANRYGQMCVASALAAPDRRASRDDWAIARTAIIDAVNALCRAMQDRGKDTAWHAVLRDDPYEVEDLACFSMSILALCGPHPSLMYCG